MTRIKSGLRILLALAVIGVTLVGRAEAASITITPASQTINVGGIANVDVVLSGLAAGEVVGAFSFVLTWNDAVLGVPLTYVADPGVKMGAGGFGFGDTTAPSPINVEYLADGSLSSVALKALEDGGFVLARISFTGLQEGLSNLVLTPAATTGRFLSDYSGELQIAASAVNGTVCVDNPQTAENRCQAAPIPEPGTLTLLGLGASALVARRRRARASKT